MWLVDGDDRLVGDAEDFFAPVGGVGAQVLHAAGATHAHLGAVVDLIVAESVEG